MKFFIDTSAFIALDDRSDAYHSRAKTYFQQLGSSDRLYTSNYIIDETATRLAYTTGSSSACRFVEAIFKSRLFERIYIDFELEKEALGVLAKYKDKKLSFTDCATIAIVKRYKLDAIFGYDDDFIAAGCRLEG